MHNARSSKVRAAALKHGWHSGLEEKIGVYLTQLEVDFDFEQLTLTYEVPSRTAKYTPDYVLANGIIIESKGRFVTADRQKMLLVKKQHPDLDIRFVFSRSKDRISKQSKTTYGMWCDKHGYLYADVYPPHEWLHEPPNRASLAALARL